jgi:MFS family permease
LDNGVSLVLCISGIVGILQEKFGPLKMLYCGAIMSTASFATLYFSFYTPDSIEILLISRALAGTGRALISSSVYLSEVLPREIRGMFVVIATLSRGLGSTITFLFGYFINFNTSGPIFGWIPIVSFIWMIFATIESPVYLVKIGQDEKATRALNRLNSTKDSAKKRYDEINSKNQNTETTNFIRRCAEPVIWKPFVIVTSLQVAQ